MALLDTSPKCMCIVLCVVALFGVVTLALAAATLGTLNKRFDALATPAATSSRPNLNSVLAETIRIDDLMNHLRQLQRIADEFNGTRAINTRGFNASVDYIYNYLQEQGPELVVKRETFTVRDFALAKDPVLRSTINGVEQQYTYAANLTRAEFTHVIYSTSVNLTEDVRVVNVLNFGCVEADWINMAGLVVLVKAGGKCTYAEKGLLAASIGVKALLFYNDGATVSSLTPASVRLRQFNTLPALSLSYAVGQALADAAATGAATVRMEIELKPLLPFPVDNVCADTVHGNVTQTIVVGSHSDSVPAGPGINDNGKLVYK